MPVTMATAMATRLQQRLQWVKVGDMSMAWPACVYETYSSACAHAHDMQGLRGTRAVPLLEDRIVVFLGVSPWKATPLPPGKQPVSDGVVPSVRVCMTTVGEMVVAPWLGCSAAAMKHMCREMKLYSATVAQAQRDPVFLEARDQAERYLHTVRTDEDAAAFFMAIVRAAVAWPPTRKQVQRIPVVVAAPTPATTDSVLEEANKTIARQDPTEASTGPAMRTTLRMRALEPATRRRAPQTKEPTFSVATTSTALRGATKSPRVQSFPGGLPEALQRACWSRMESRGWSALVQSDGCKLYAQPGVSFLQFQPNVNVFDNLEGACLTFLADWAVVTLDEMERKQEENETQMEKDMTVHDLVWQFMTSRAWTTMHNGNDTWVCKPNTPFDQFKPDVTIFRSKERAMVAFLCGSTDLESEENGHNTENADSVANDESDGVEDSEMESVDNTQNEISDGSEAMGEPDEASKVDADGISEQESAVGSDLACTPIEIDGDSEDEGCEEEATATRATMPASGSTDQVDAEKVSDKPTGKRRARPTDSSRDQSFIPPNNRAAPGKHTTVPPPFKFNFGTVEAELSKRGWTWCRVPLKKSLDGYMYYPPKSAASTSTAAAEEYPGRLAVESYLESCGLYDEIRNSLRREYEQRYFPGGRGTGSGDDSKKNDVIMISEDESANPLHEAEKATLQGRVDISRRKTRSVKTPSVLIPVEPRARNRTRRQLTRDARSKKTQDTPKVVGFGPIWQKLQSQGWHLRSGRFEYDYFQPYCKYTSEGIQGKDYFTSSLELTDYLQGCGLWDSLAAQILKEEEKENEDPGAEVEGMGASAAIAGASENSASTGGRLGHTNSMLTPEFASTTGRRKRGHTEAPPTPTDMSTQSTIMGHTPLSKKSKTSRAVRAAFQTPSPTPGKARDNTATHSKSTKDDSNNLSVLTSRISPDADGSRARHEGVNSNGGKGGTAPSRKLTDAFTPSPLGSKGFKRDKGPSTSSTSLSSLFPIQSHSGNVTPVTRRVVAQQVVNRLTLGYLPSEIQHREKEARKFRSFCRDCFSKCHGGSLYISGAPGCGKSALLRSLEAQITATGGLYEETCKGGNTINPLVWVHVNAMGLDDCGRLYCRLAEKITKKAFTDGEDAFAAIERATNTSSKRYKTLLLVMDEIDVLGKSSTMERELCRLFELSHRASHSFILVGIANQVDFTERHLSQLRRQLPLLSPSVVVFKPYTFQTIRDILVDRLGGENAAAELMNLNGISFIARKVAAQSGDVRLALDICRRSLQQKLSDAAAAAGSDSDAGFASPISLSEIVKMIKIVLDSKSKSAVSSLPRNLQMIMFASTRLVALHASAGSTTNTAKPSNGASTESTSMVYRVDDLFDCYCDASHAAGVFKPMTRGEFKVALQTLTSEGLLGAGELHKQLIKLLCTPSELLLTFKQDPYFSRLL